MTRRRRTVLASLALGAALVVAGIALATVLVEEPVRTGPKDEYGPAAEFNANGVDNLIWTERPNVQPGRGAFNAFLRKGSGSKIKLNAKGQGVTGGIDPPWVVYQQMVDNESDLKLYRIDTRKRPKPPKGLNTKDWEFGPSISGKWILFGRDDDESNLKRLVLFNRSTRKSRVLATLNGENNFVFPGQVNGDWAVWSVCRTDPACDVFRYRISSKAKTKLGRPAGPDSIAQYSPGVLTNGVVYAARSGDGCGATVRIVRFFRAGDPSDGSEIAALPAGIDAWTGWARTRPDDSVDYLYERVTCTNRKRDAYRVNDPPPP